jgi:phosphoglycerol transferase MdoB-like AlkP superfamily enzyme
MNFINYFLTSLIVFAALISGIIIRHFTKEEMKEGEKYFILLQRLLALIIVGVFLYFMNTKIYWIIIALFVVSTLIYQFDVKLPVYYVFFGSFLFFSSKEMNFFLIISSLIFLFGFPSGSLIKKEDVKKNLLLSCLFFLSAFGFYVVSLL